MKKSILICFVFLVAGLATAQNHGHMVKKARPVAGQNNVEQPPPAPVSPADTNTDATEAPVDPALQLTLKNISSLQADLAALSQGANPGSAQKISLLNDLSQAAQGSPAATNSVQKLADDLATTIIGQKKLLAPQQIRLAREVHALFNSSHLVPTQQQTVLADIQKTLVGSGCNTDMVAAVADDLKTVSDQTK